jgi:hypothetical protein
LTVLGVKNAVWESKMTFSGSKMTFSGPKMPFSGSKRLFGHFNVKWSFCVGLHVKTHVFGCFLVKMPFLGQNGVSRSKMPFLGVKKLLTNDFVGEPPENHHFPLTSYITFCIFQKNDQFLQVFTYDSITNFVFV